ncbi:MAG: DUF3618 domain-containing protein [Actinomycetota bacterium]|nr:DUF3618 domain-containing protein [Actinomycetota bacterium]
MSSPSKTSDEIAAEIAAEIAETRNRLAGTIDQLAYRIKPQTIVQRQIAATKAAFVNADGSLRTDRVLKVGGVVVGVVALIVAIRKVAG